MGIKAKPGMLVPYDPYDIDDRPVALTAEYIDALEAVLRAECAMMIAQDPSDAPHWQWGRVELAGLGSSRHITVTFGGPDDDPEDGYGAFAVVIAETPSDV